MMASTSLIALALLSALACASNQEQNSTPTSNGNCTYPIQAVQESVFVPSCCPQPDCPLASLREMRSPARERTALRVGERVKSGERDPDTTPPSPLAPHHPGLRS